MQESPATPQVSPLDEGSVDEEQVSTLVDAADQVIYGGDTPEGELSSPVAGMLRGSGGNASDPVQSLADTSAHIMSKVIAVMGSKNQSLDQAAVWGAMKQVVEELGNAAEHVGLYDYGPEEMNAAMTRSGETLYSLTKDTGMWPQEEAVKDAASIAEASQSGEMDEAITMMEKEDASGGGGGQPLGKAMQGQM